MFKNIEELRSIFIKQTLDITFVLWYIFFTNRHKHTQTDINTGAISLFQAKVFGFNTKKTPQTEENLLYKMAQPLFRASGALFEFNMIHCFFGVFQANFTPKSTFWPLSTGSSSILTSDSSLKSNFSPRKYKKHLCLARLKYNRNFRFSENVTENLKISDFQKHSYN